MSTRLTKAQVLHVATLANLSVNDEEAETLQQELGRILEYIDTLDKLPTKGVESTSQVTGLENVVRNDFPDDSLLQEQALSNTKTTSKGLVVVDAVFGEE